MTALTYHHQKVINYLGKMDAQIDEIRMFGKQIERSSQKSAQNIDKHVEKKRDMITYFVDKSTKKSFDNINYIIEEKEYNERDLVWIKGKLQGWVEQQKGQIKIWKEKAKKIESKRLNKQLKQDETKDFMEQLVKASIQHKKNIQMIVSSLSQWKMRECCFLVEKLTAEMQMMKKIEKGKDKKEGK